MSLILINLRRAEDRRDVIHRAVQTLAEGKLVVFPTETEYVVAASARSVSGVRRLVQWSKGSAADGSLLEGQRSARPLAAEGRSGPSEDPRGARAGLCLGIRGVEDALDYVPQLRGVALRLARRCWPGPVELALAPESHESLLRQLPREVGEAVAPEGELWLRTPAHPAVLEVLQMSAGPLVLATAERACGKLLATSEEAVRCLRGTASLVLDDGPCRYGQAATAVRAGARHYACLREGVVPATALERLASMLIVVVCTGNTCRSPMAEALLRRLLAERLGCEETALGQFGIEVASAGIAAASGSRASPEAVEAMRQRGLDIACHASQPLTENLVRDADLILTLTGGHRHAIVSRWPEVAARVATLRADQGDVDDPIGAPSAVYRQCAAQIEQALKERMAEWDLDNFLGGGSRKD